MAYEDLGTGEKMASMRTSLAFQRTRMAADRTMMASLRTALSLIGFGFTIFSFFRTLAGNDLLGDALPPLAPARFGLALVALGVITLSLGIYGDVRFNQSLRRQRQTMIDAGLLPGDDDFPRSLALVSAFLLLLVGLFAILSITLRVGPFR
jgi:putative membrane protein